MDAPQDTNPPASGVVDDIGERIGDLRTHLSHAHPLRAEWLIDLEAADLAALHRRLHGRSVDPDPTLVDVHHLEIATDTGVRARTTLPVAHATDPDDPKVWLPLRIADHVHALDSPGHVGRGGCRACADLVDASIRALGELDTTPQRELAVLVAINEELLEALATAHRALVSVATWIAALDADPELAEAERDGGVLEGTDDRLVEARARAEADLLACVEVLTRLAGGAGIDQP